MTLEQHSPELEDSSKVWDDQALLRTLGPADSSVHHRLLRRFADYSDNQLRELSRLCEQGDFLAMGTLAHNAKTAARTVGAMQLGQLCDQLESSCAEGDASMARRLVVKVLCAYDAIQSYLPQPTSASQE